MLAIAIIAYWGYQFLIYASVYTLVEGCYRNFAGRTLVYEQPKALIQSQLLGLSVTGLVLQPISIFLPLDFLTHVIFVLALALTICAVAPLRRIAWGQITIVRHKLSLIRLKGNFLTVLVVSGIVLLCLIYACMPVTPYDTGLYHAQSIELIRQYPAIPGIGNLHDRLAFNNAWFLNIAFFSHGVLASKPFLFQNSYALLLLYSYLLSGIYRYYSRADERINFFRLIYFLTASAFYFSFPLFVSSVSPDTPAYILQFYVISEILLHFEVISSRQIYVLFLIMIFCIAIKFSAVYSLLIFLPVILSRSAGLRPLLPLVMRLAIIGILALLPFFWRNYLLSGYLVYPLYQLDFFNPDWKIPRELAVAQVSKIAGWARLPGPDFANSLKMNIFQWFPGWVKVYRTEPLIRFTAGTLLVSIVGIYALVKQTLLRQSKWLLVTLLVVNAAWFFSAPHPRFAHGTLVPLCAFFIASLGLYFHKSFNALGTKRRSSIALIMLILIIAAPLVKIRDSEFNSGLASMHAGHKYPTPSTVAVQNTQGRTLFVPANGREECWNWSPLCMPYLRDKVVFRGNSIEQGFADLSPKAAQRNEGSK